MELKKLKFMGLLLLLVLLTITIISYEVYAEEVSFIEVGEEYLISLSYDHGGLVKVLEIDGSWIRCEIVLGEIGVFKDLVEMQEEEIYEDIWFNTQEIEFIITNINIPEL